jgi:hypothetical protein
MPLPSGLDSVAGAKIDLETGQIRSDLRRLEDKMDSGFAQMKNLLENASLRAELEASREHR